MRNAVFCLATVALATSSDAQPSFENVGAALQGLPFAKFGSSALDAFSGVGANIDSLAIGTVFKRIAESSRATEASPENTAYKFLRSVTPAFSTDAIEDFLSSPLHLVDGNPKLASFFEQTQSVAKKQFGKAARSGDSPSNLRRLQKQAEGFDGFYNVFENVGKTSFLDGKSPEDAATDFLTEVTSYPSAAISSFLSIPTKMQHVSPSSFFARMRDAALMQNGLPVRRLQLDELKDTISAPLELGSQFAQNLPFASQINMQELPGLLMNPLKGIQQISSMNPIAGVSPFSAVDGTVLSEINPLNRMTEGEGVPSKFVSHFRDTSKRVIGDAASDERRM